MGVMQDCEVYLRDGTVIKSTSVLFKDNGWVRIGDAYPYTYKPPHAIQEIVSHEASIHA